jgi:alpha-tubulin suppressor-like RCC1 family protein
LPDGGVRCWGHGGNWTSNRDWPLAGADRLGKGPASSELIPLEARVVHVTSGLDHSCVLLEGGSVVCWGQGPLLGIGSSNGVDSLRERVRPVKLGGKAVQVDAGLYHTCALMDHGGVRCWGFNGFGQLGYPDQETVGIYPETLASSVGDVPLGVAALQIAAGPKHTCALLCHGKVRCWGHNKFGQLGHSAQHSSRGLDPAELDDVELGGAAIQITASAGHSCALLESRRVRCWGDPGYAGYGASQDSLSPAAAGDVDAGGDVIELVAGSHHTCALLSNGAVRCWGSARWGQLGYGDFEFIGDDELPEAAGDVPLGGEVFELAAG